MVRRLIVAVPLVILLFAMVLGAQAVLATQGAQADLAVSKADAPDPAQVGGNLTYTLTVTNNGPAQATGIVLTDTLPAMVTLVSATPSQGSCSVAGNAVTCSLGGLGGSASAAATIVVTPTAGGTLSNTASVTATEADPNTANNTATATTLVNAADLAVSKADAPDPAQVGSNLTYTLTVTNNGPAQATGIVLTDTLPATVTLVSATPSQGSCSAAGNAVTCSLGGLGGSASATATIVVIPTAVGTLSNTASVTATEPDPNTANNTSVQVTSVAAAAPAPTSADLRVTKSDSPDPVQVGSPITYLVTVRNHGPAAAAGVTLTDILVGEFSFVSVAASQGSCSGTGPVTCALGDLAKDGTASVTMVVKATAAGTLLNLAVATSSAPEANTANNVAIERTKVLHTQQRQPRTSKIEFTGEVQTMPSGSLVGAWKIQGLTVNVSATTEIKGEPQVGSLVKVEGTLSLDGVVAAKEIKVKGEHPEELRDSDDERPGHGFGDRHHRHSGPPGLADRDDDAHHGDEHRSKADREHDDDDD